MILKIRATVLSLTLFYSLFFSTAFAHDHHEHDHSSHDVQTEIAELTEDLEKFHNELKENPSEETIAHWKGHLAHITASAIVEIEDQKDAGLLHKYRYQKVLSWASHQMEHFNLVALFKRVKKMVKARGPIVGVALAATLSSEWLAGYYGMTHHDSILGKMALTYCGLHLDEVLFLTATTVGPKVYARTKFYIDVARNFESWSDFEGSLLKARKEIALDFSLNPYVDPAKEFIVLRKRPLRFLPDRLRRFLLPEIVAQEQALPTLTKRDLRKLIYKYVTLPKTHLSFEAEMNIAIEQLRQHSEGYFELGVLISAAKRRATLATYSESCAFLLKK